MIDLATCDDFDLGEVTVRPSSRELVGRDGIRTIEPKVMQMLVVLAARTGQVVSRQDLIDQCWPGRVVGEDAINRVVGKLRKVVQDIIGGTIRLETVARVGLRLIDRPHPAPSGPPPVTAGAPVARPFRRAALAVVLPAIAAAGGMAWWIGAPLRLPPTPERTAPSTLPPAVTDFETRGLSSMFENTPEGTAEGVAYLRLATAEAPQSAPVWGSLAMAYVLTLGWAPPSERAATIARVRGAAERAQALDPGEPGRRRRWSAWRPPLGTGTRSLDCCRRGSAARDPKTGRYPISDCSS